MLYREIIAVCSEIHIKHINTLCGQNVEFFSVKPGGIYSNHRALERLSSSKNENYAQDWDVTALSNFYDHSKAHGNRNPDTTTE